jgi:hypothetical protein
VVVLGVSVVWRVEIWRMVVSWRAVERTVVAGRVLVSVIVLSCVVTTDWVNSKMETETWTTVVDSVSV